MKLRNRILLFFAGSFPVILGIALLAVYFSMAEYREEEFLQRLKEKTTTTLRLLIDVQKIDHALLRALDETTINNLYDEKILLFDSAGRTIYASVDDTSVLFPLEVLKDLKGGRNEIFYREGQYDVYAHVIEKDGEKFYAIGKANDIYGKEKLRFLVWILLGVFIISVILEALIALYLSRQISQPIVRLTNEVSDKSINNLTQVYVPSSRDEIASLANGFNTMLARVEQSYSYQKNLIHHVSHELKTPIAVLISNIERVLNEKDPQQWQESLEFQKNGLMQMSTVVTTLLDISKYETDPAQVFTESVRVDELLFSCIESLQTLSPAARFEVAIHQSVNDAAELTCPGNERMLHIAFINVLKNAIAYSGDERVTVEVSAEKNFLQVLIDNNGATLSQKEQSGLFTYFFRGQNSYKKIGIGLGLVMVSKIIRLHRGSIAYHVTETGKNRFIISLPQS
ncbi:MAG: HAMP domain-containing histidine kinase [Cyclobacteriaceae bacterium]|nr:HAMP domain-containing histidine kinase [Cyclobacteriaceae bacterium]